MMNIRENSTTGADWRGLRRFSSDQKIFRNVFGIFASSQRDVKSQKGEIKMSITRKALVVVIVFSLLTAARVVPLVSRIGLNSMTFAQSIAGAAILSDEH